MERLESQLDQALCLHIALVPIPLPSDNWCDSTVMEQLQKKNPDVLVLFLLSSAAAAAPKRKVQTTLSNLVVRGVDAIVQETKQKIGT